MNAIEVGAGPELDARIARVLRQGCDVLPSGAVVDCFADIPPKPYSTDWSAAMEAAEQVGLFGGGRHALYRYEPCDEVAAVGGRAAWLVGQAFDDGCYGAEVAAPTGPLAICWAILSHCRSSA